MKPLLTVVIPVYNVEKYLKRCVESVLVQGWHNYDILLVDDGSTDSSPQICDDYVKAYDFISVIHKENGGLSDARNAGIAVCTGEYIGFVDSDDTVEPDMYELLYCNAKKYEVDISMCRSNRIVNSSIIRDNSSRHTQVLLGRENIIRFLFTQSGQTISVCLKIFKKEIVRAIFPVGKTSEDAFVALQFMKNDSKLVVDYVGKYNYRLREGSITRQKLYRRSLLDCVEAYERNCRIVAAESMACQLAAERRLGWAWGNVMWQILETSNYQQHYWKVRYLQKKIQQNYHSLLKNPYCRFSDKVTFTLAAISPVLYKIVRNMTENLRR